MRLIKCNPYRTVGLLVGATAREQARQIKRLNQFIDAEQEPEDDFSFPVLGKIKRTVDSVTDSASKLNLDSDKMNASLFWFYIGNQITDEPAFDALKDADIDQAINIWTKLTSSTEVTQRNASAYSNLGTLYLCQNANEDNLEQGIYLKLKFLESDFIKEFKALATDETYRTTKKELQVIFLNQVQTEIERGGEISPSKFLEIVSKQTFSAKDVFLKDFAQKPIEQIEKQIEETRKNQKANPAKAGDFGNELFKVSKPLLTSIISILGKSNIKIISISDKIANEILQCSINLFNHFHETGTEVGEIALDLNSKAKSIALGSVVRERINESTPIVLRYISDKPEREKQSKITSDFEALKRVIDEYESKSETVANAKQLLSTARRNLNNIKDILGSTEEIYLGISTRIASDAQGMCVSEINKLQEKISSTYDNLNKMTSLILLKHIVNEAYDITTTIGNMDLRQDFRSRYITNRNSLSSLKTQLAIVNTGSSSGSSGSSSGCYIATMAYGNYDHPQVLILRQFRDNVLNNSEFGKWFIKTYYFYSPKLVERLKNKKAVNSLIRSGLDQIIKLIK